MIVLFHDHYAAVADAVDVVVARIGRVDKRTSESCSERVRARVIQHPLVWRGAAAREYDSSPK